MLNAQQSVIRNFVMMVIALCTVAACGGGEKDNTEETTPVSADGIVIHRGNGTEPNTLDPHQSNGVWESAIIGDMLLGLFTEDAYGKPIYGAAIDHTISEDALTHTFKLRPGMKWSDGAPVTAEDFVFAWQRILDPATAAPYASLIYPFKNARAINAGDMPPSALGARAIDDLTLELDVEHPVPFIRTLMTHVTTYPVPKHVVEEFGDDWIKPEHYVGNGPYTLETWRPNSYVKIVRNKYFYDNDNIQIDTAYYYPTDDVSAAFRRFRAGEIDVNSCTQCYPIQQVDFIDKTMPGVKHNEIYLSTTYISFNTNIKPYDDVRVRRAIGLAIDRNVLVEKVLRAGQVPAYALVPPTIDNYVAEGPKMEEAGWTQEQRNAKAIALLTEAGYDENNPLTINVKYRLAGDRKQIMVAMQDMWRQVGINAKLDGKEPKVAYADYRARNFEVADAGWVADYNDPDNFLFLTKGDTGLMNYADYQNPEFDALMDQAANMVDLQARAEVMARAEAIMLKDMPIVPLYFDVKRNLVGLHIQNWNDNALGIQRTRWLSIDESKRKTY
ncbi:MAG: peptide ABC transporter substrate-binding protein [bacterium]